MRHAWIEIDLAAVAHNVRALARRASPAELCVVVKADGYGHGAVPVARTALGAGATTLAVAIVDEGVALRDAGIDAPILILSECGTDEYDEVVGFGLTPTVYRAESIDAAERAAARAGTRLRVHCKVDSGMRRVGVAPEHAVETVARIVASEHLDMGGLFTHLAVADEPDNAFTDAQLRRFAAVRTELEAAGLPTGAVHTHNSAATLRQLGAPADAGAIAAPLPGSDLVRCGISVYGFPPSPAVDDPVGLRPALSVHARVSYVKTVRAGEGVSYGLRWHPDVDTRVVTVPLGYADGVRRILSRRGAEVLIGGRRYPIVGTITMDQFLVDVGPGATVDVGAEVVLLGRQGDAEITAQEWADRLDTITYEIVCSFGPRLPRIHLTGIGIGRH